MFYIKRDLREIDSISIQTEKYSPFIHSLTRLQTLILKSETHQKIVISIFIQRRRYQNVFRSCGRFTYKDTSRHVGKVLVNLQEIHRMRCRSVDTLGFVEERFWKYYSPREMMTTQQLPPPLYRQTHYDI